MVEFEIKVHETERLAYIPRQLYAVLGSRVKAIANRTAVLFFPENATLEDVARSLEIITADVQHAITLKQKEA